MTNSFESENRQPLSKLLDDASSAMDNKRWQRAIAIVEHILTVDPEFPGAAWRLAEAQKQRQIEIAYDIAYKRMQDDDWPEAIRKLRVVEHQSPEFRNTYVLLRICQRKAAARTFRRSPSSIGVKRVVVVGSFAMAGATICYLMFGTAVGRAIVEPVMAQGAEMAREVADPIGQEVAAVGAFLTTFVPQEVAKAITPEPTRHIGVTPTATQNATPGASTTPTPGDAGATETPGSRNSKDVANPTLTLAPGGFPEVTKLPTSTNTPVPPTRTPTRTPIRPTATATRVVNGTPVPPPPETPDSTEATATVTPAATTGAAPTQAATPVPPQGTVVVTVFTPTNVPTIAPTTPPQNSATPTSAATATNTPEPANTPTPVPTGTATPVPPTPTTAPPILTPTPLPPPTNTSTATPRPPTATSPPPTPTRIPTAVPLNITATEYRFTPSSASYPAGTKIRISLANAGTIDHNLVLKNPSGNAILELQVLPQTSQSKEVVLNSPGTYQFVCDLSDHAHLGMSGSITIR